MRRIKNKREIQYIELEILDILVNFFKKHRILYSFGGGTLIGAIRHQGFIPWDDDIDLFMMRDQYEKFIDLLPNDRMISDNIKVMLPGDKNYLYPFIKVVNTNTVVYEKNIEKKYNLGIWIDIFPIDNCYENENKNIELLKNRKRIILNLIRSSSKYGESKVRTILKKLLIICWNLVGKNTEYWIKEALNLPKIKKSVYAGTIVWPLSSKDIYPISFFDEYIEVIFEGKKYKAFKKFDDILRWRFGDYMKLPPENERHYHEFEAYYIGEE